MALLKIIKLSNKTWKHNSDVDGNFILTKFYAKQEDNEFLLVETYGSKRRKYSISEIEVYDIGGSAETFTNFDDLFLRLEALKYPAFYKDGDMDLVWGSITGDLSDQTDLQNALDLKLNKVTTSGVERVYTINADGSQGTKPTSDFKDVIEGYFNGTNFYTDSGFTNLITPESSKIYVALDTNLQYRWSGSAYVQIGGNPKKSIEYNVTSLCIYNFPATSNWTYASGFNGMGAYGAARVDSVNSNFLTLIASANFNKVIGGIAPFDMKLTSNGSFVTPEPNLVGGDLKLSVGYIEFNYSTGVITNATLVDAGTYTPATGGRVDLREDFGGEITIPKGAIWCYSWAHTKTSAVSGIYIQTILNFEEV